MVERTESKEDGDKRELIKVQEIEVNLSLLNNKLNYIISLLEKITKKN